MTIRQYIIIMILASIMCWIAWGFVLFNIDPTQGSTLGFVFFYIALFFALMGTCSVLAFPIVRLRAKDVPMYRQVKMSFRDGIAVAGLFIILLYLQAEGVLTLWNLGVFVVILFLIMIFSYSNKKQQEHLSS